MGIEFNPDIENDDASFLDEEDVWYVCTVVYI
jgi:hypothetical protein